MRTLLLHITFLNDNILLNSLPAITIQVVLLSLILCFMHCSFLLSRRGVERSRLDRRRASPYMEQFMVAFDTLYGLLRAVQSGSRLSVARNIRVKGWIHEEGRRKNVRP
jgi:hypothetical protein